MIIKIGKSGNNFRALIDYLSGEMETKHLQILDPERYARQEQMLLQAQALATGEHHKLDQTFVNKIITEVEASKGFEISQEQKDAIYHAACEQSGLACIEGAAGSGKSVATADVMARAYKQRGYEVKGFCTSLAAADNLAQETGIKTSSIAMFKTLYEKNEKFREEFEQSTDKQLWIVDEAGMVAADDMAFLVGLAAENPERIKLELVGETLQLDAIGREQAGAFKAIQDKVGRSTIDTIIRQSLDQDDAHGNWKWRRDMVEHARQGRGTEALQELDKRGLVNILNDGADAKAALIEDWKANYLKGKEAGAAVHTPILAQRWKDIFEMQTEIKTFLREQGEITGQDFTFNCLVSGKVYEGATLAAGEHIRFTQNDYKKGLTNGLQGTIKEIRELKDIDGVVYDHEFVIELDKESRKGEKIISFKASEYQNENHPGALPIINNYCMTIFASQGQTFRDDGMLYGGNAAHLGRANTYVGLSRAKENTAIYLDGSELEYLASMEKFQDTGIDFTREQLIETAGHLFSKDDRQLMAYQKAEEMGLKNLEEVEKFLADDMNAYKTARNNIIGGNIHISDDNRDMAAQFREVAKQREESGKTACEKPVMQISLSAAIEDGQLSDEKWREIADKYLDRIFDGQKKTSRDNHQYLIYRHTDKEYDHVHIVLNKVGLDGEIMRDSFIAKKSIEIAREIELEYGLKQALTKEQIAAMDYRAKVHSQERNQFERLKEKYANNPEHDTSKWVAPPKEYIHTTIKTAIEMSGGDAQAFAEICRASGVEMQIKQNKDNAQDRGTAVFTITDSSLYPPEMSNTFSGYKISKNCTLDMLEARLTREYAKQLENIQEQTNDNRQSLRDYIAEARESGAEYRGAKSTEIREGSEQRSGEQRADIAVDRGNEERTIDAGERAAEGCESRHEENNEANGSDWRRNRKHENGRQHGSSIYEEHSRDSREVRHHSQDSRQPGERDNGSLLAADRMDERGGASHERNSDRHQAQRKSERENSSENHQDKSKIDDGVLDVNRTSDRNDNTRSVLGSGGIGKERTQDGYTSNDKGDLRRAGRGEEEVSNDKTVAEARSSDIRSEGRIAEKKMLKNMNALIDTTNKIARNRVNERINYILSFDKQKSELSKVMSNPDIHNTNLADKLTEVVRDIPREIYAAYAYRALTKKDTEISINEPKTQEWCKKLDQIVVHAMTKEGVGDQVKAALEQGSPGWMDEKIKQEIGKVKANTAEYEQELKKKADLKIEEEKKLKLKKEKEQEREERRNRRLNRIRENGKERELSL